MKCKKCNHELESTEYEGRLTIRHATRQTHEGDGGDYEYCSVMVVECDKCKREHECRCNTPTI